MSMVPTEATLSEPGSPSSADGVSLSQLTAAIGAEVSGVDLGGDVSDAVIQQLRVALHQHGVLIFREQTLDSDHAQIELASRFGPIYRHALISDDELPITILDSGNKDWYGDKRNHKRDRIDYNTGWHSDATFEERPPYLAILRSVMLPPLGGDTLWASMYAAYEGLSSKVQRLIDDLEAVHDPALVMSATYTTEGLKSKPHTHPVVISDPITKRKAIYVNPNYVTHIVGLSRHESQNILNMLYGTLNDPEYQVRHRWAPGSIAIWQERITQHFGVGDYRERRIMHRVIVASEPPVS
jgi:taurine dioxygenase